MPTLAELQMRHSVRSYKDYPLDEQMRNKLKSIVTDINTHGVGLKFQLEFDDSDPFRGFTRSYGMFRNAKNYLAAVVDTSFPYYMERAGYYAEQFVIAATELGIGTCFVGGTFSSDHVNSRIRAGEKLAFLVIFGVPETEKVGLVAKLTSKMAHRKSLEPEEFYVDSGVSLTRALEIMPALQDGLKALACAPSAINKQPVRVTMDQNGMLRMYLASTSKYTDIDLGIAKYNFQCVVEGVWNWGVNGTFEI